MNSLAKAHSTSFANDADRGKPVTEYRMPAKVFHWVTAALVLVMVCLGVIGKQLDGGEVSDTLMELHRTSGILTLIVVLMRIGYRLTDLNWAGSTPSDKRPFIHWMLYAVIVCVPVLGWAGASAFGATNILFGYSLPAIWWEGGGYGDLLLALHAYVAFALLGLVALHIGFAMQDYMTRSRGGSQADD